MGDDIYEGYDPEARAYFEALDYGHEDHDDEWKLLEEAHQENLRAENPPAKAFVIPKPSWFQRLLDWVA